MVQNVCPTCRFFRRPTFWLAVCFVVVSGFFLGNLVGHRMQAAADREEISRLRRLLKERKGDGEPAERERGGSHSR